MKRIRLSSGRYTIIDEEDAKFLFGKKLSESTNGYARININSKKLTLHRFLMKAREGVFVDHINGNKLDNRRSNLRFCSKSQNGMNRPKPLWKKAPSVFKGVGWLKKNKRWRATIQLNGKQTHIGCFDSDISAARAYDIAAKKMFGKFAYQNFAT